MKAVSRRAQEKPRITMALRDTPRVNRRSTVSVETPNREREVPPGRP